MSRKIALIASVSALNLRIAADTAKLASLNKQVEAFDLIEGIEAGTSVSFLIGRAETRQEVVGRVTAVKAGDVTVNEETLEETVGARKFKVEYTPTGDAFDATFAVIAESQVISVGIRGADAVVEAEEDVAPAETPEFDAPEAE